MQNLWRHLQKDLELVNGLSLDQVLRKSGILPRIVHKELGIMLRKRCYWNSQKADILFSVQRLHCPEDSWKVKEKGRCPYTSVLIRIQLIQFIALFFLSMSSVSTEQWQLYAMNMKATKIARGNPLYCWDSQLFLEKSKQKFLPTMKNPETTKSFCSNMFNKLNRFHQKTEWVNSVRKQDLCVLSKLDNISWQEMLVILDNFVQWLVVITLFPETIQLYNQKGGSEEIWELDL